MTMGSAAFGTPAGHLDVIDAVSCIPAIRAAHLRAVAVHGSHVTLSNGEEVPVKLTLAMTGYGPIIVGVEIR